MLTIKIFSNWVALILFFNFVFVNIFALIINVNQLPKSQKQLNNISLKRYGLVFSSAFTGILATQSISNKPAQAVSGAIKTSSLQESKDAVTVVKKCLDGIISMENSLQKSDYDEIGRILSGSEYQEFEKAATILVRSDLLTADEKVSLGTIKRYGLVADAIIMLGGLGGELRQGGVKVAGASNPNASGIIEDDDSDEPDEKPIINASEVKKYINLSKDALSDVYKVVAPILSKK